MTADQLALFGDPVEEQRAERRRIIQTLLAALDGTAPNSTQKLGAERPRKKGRTQ
jgi:hypothetical protein